MLPANALREHRAEDDLDPLISVRDIRERVPWFPEVSRFTLVRWIQRGVKRPDGSRLRCRAVKLGQSWFTRASWLRTFVDELSTPAEARPRETGRHVASGDAEAILAADGI